MAFLFILYLISQDGEKSKIEAGRMEIIQMANERVSYFSEGLTISTENIEIQAREGYYFPNHNLFIIKGEVVIKNEEVELKGDSCIYHLTSQESELYKNVEINLETLSIFTNHLKLNSRERTAHCEEILLIPKGKNLELQARDGVHNLTKRYGRAHTPFILIKGEEPTSVKAKEVFYTQPTAQLLLTSEVEVLQRERKILCDTLIYFIQGDSGICAGNPYLKGEREEIRGKYFTFWTEGGELKGIRARDDCSVSYETGEERIEISGQEFCALLTKGEISEVSIKEITQGRLIRRRGGRGRVP